MPSFQLQAVVRPKPQRRHGPFGVTVIKTRLALQVNRPLSSRPFISLPIVPEILSTSNPLLLKAARLIKQLPAGTLVEVAGYTYNIGSPTINMQLSQRRANAVRRALVRAGVDPAMLTAKGYGGSHDLSVASQNGTVEGRSSGANLSNGRIFKGWIFEFRAAQSAAH
jgi:OmpA family